MVFGYRDIYTDRVEEQSVGKEYKFSRKEALLELHGGRLLSFAWNKYISRHYLKQCAIQLEGYMKILQRLIFCLIKQIPST